MKKLPFLLFSALVASTSISAQTHITSQVNSSDDDAEEDLSDGSMDLTSSDLEMCLEDNIWPVPNDDQTIGIRFTQINVPNGAIIDSAFIQFGCDETSNDPTTVVLSGEDINNSVQFFELDYNISLRTKTSQNVTWSINDWDHSDEASSFQKTPDLSSIVQHIVNRSGWQSGNALSFIITGSGHRVAHSYDGNSNLAPVLHIFFSAVSDLDNTTSKDARIYPNPSNQKFFVEGVENGTYDIIDLSGRVVQTGKINVDRNVIRHEQPPGVYFLKLKDSNAGSSITKRLIFY